MNVSAHRLDCVWYVHEQHPVLKIELASKLRLLMLPQGEHVPPGYMYILNRGVALYAGKVKRATVAWGEDILLGNESLQLHVSALAMSYITLYVMDPSSLASIFASLPELSKKLDRVRLRWACRRMIVHAAELAMFGQGLTFFGRNYPLYGKPGLTHVGTLGRHSKGVKGTSEWWMDDGNNETVSEVVDMQSTPAVVDAQLRSVSRRQISRISKDKSSQARRRESTREKRITKEREEKAHQIEIEEAARLFGAQKIRRAALMQAEPLVEMEKLLEQAHAKLQIELQAVTQKQHALDTTVVDGMRALSAQLLALQEAVEGHVRLPLPTAQHVPSAMAGLATDRIGDRSENASATEPPARTPRQGSLPAARQASPPAERPQVPPLQTPPIIKRATSKGKILVVQLTA
jgi:hypothetical protein